MKKVLTRYGSEKMLVKEEIVEVTRWSIGYRIVFKFEGKFYRTGYSVGATEMQDEQPWQDEEEVECDEVRQVEKVVIDYELVE